jgi:hypothetical protein
MDKVTPWTIVCHVIATTAGCADNAYSLNMRADAKNLLWLEIFYCGCYIVSQPFIGKRGDKEQKIFKNELKKEAIHILDTHFFSQLDSYKGEARKKMLEWSSKQYDERIKEYSKHTENTVEVLSEYLGLVFEPYLKVNFFGITRNKRKWKEAVIKISNDIVHQFEILDVTEEE